MGFIFNDITSGSMDIKARLTSWQVCGKMRNFTTTVPGKYGVADFGADFDYREITVHCNIYPKHNFTSLVSALDDIAIPVMGSYCDVIGVRSFAKFNDKAEDYEERVLEQFIRHSGRPVFSMEAATRHPLQSFADLITIEEYKTKERPKVVMTWAPHPNALPQAVPNSFAEWMNAADYDFVITHPEGYELAPQFVGRARVEYDQRKALEGADFVYAKNWAAYADPNYGKVLCRDRAWTVDAEKMALTDNAFFMHCLPVRRNMIVTDEVIESPRSLVIPEAANREISAQVVLKRLLEGLG